MESSAKDGEELRRFDEGIPKARSAFCIGILALRYLTLLDERKRCGQICTPSY